MLEQPCESGSDHDDLSDYNEDTDQSDSEETQLELLDSDSDVSEYSLDDESGSQDSEADVDEETNLRILTESVVIRLAENASTLKPNPIRKLLSAYACAVSHIASEEIKINAAITPDNEKKKTKFKSLKKENSRILKGVSDRMREKLESSKQMYVIKNPDVYTLLVSKTLEMMSLFLKQNTLSESPDAIASVAQIVRKFFSTAIIQLGFAFQVFDICRETLISLSSPHVMKWIAVFKNTNNQFVKIVCSLLSGHPQKAARINCLQFLQQYLTCLKDSKLITTQLFQPKSSYLVNVIQLTVTDAKAVSNEAINFLLQRCYRSQIKAVYNGLTFKNFGLFKLSQNCITELYSAVPYPNLYTHVFRSIRDLGMNIRREWTTANKKQPDPLNDDKNRSLTIAVCSWGFIEAINIWVGVVSRSKDKLETLIYPLVTVITSAIKVNLQNLNCMPFVLHLLTALNILSDGTDKFIPISSIIFQLLESLKSKDLVKLDKAAKETNSVLEKTDDIMVKLKLSNKQIHMSQTYKTLYKHIEIVLVDHLGIVSLNPSFPEFSIPILTFLRIYVRNEHVPEEFKTCMTTLIQVVEDTCEKIKGRRLQLEEKSGTGSKLKVFTSDCKSIPTYKHRLDILSRYQQLNKEKVTGTMAASKI